MSEAFVSLYAVDLSGRRFGRLVVESFAGSRNHAYWNCRCKCGEPRKARGSKLLTGQVTQCVKCSQVAGATAGRLKRMLPGDEAAFREVFGEYQQNAKTKGRTFCLTRDEAKRLFQSSCHFCGVRPSSIRKSKPGASDFLFNGIDRLDNHKGYEKGNAVPCCRECNYAKRDMSAFDFLAWVQRVHEHQQGNP